MRCAPCKWAVALAMLAAGCAPPARTPQAPLRSFPSQVDSAELLGQSARTADAAQAYLGIVADAAARPTDSDALAAAAVGVDALVFRRLSALSDLGSPHALSFLVPDGPASTRERFETIWNQASPGAALVRPLVANGALALAQYDGDAAAAASWRERTGCVRRVVVFGPLAPSALPLLASPLELERPGSALPSTLSAALPGAIASPGAAASADGCDIPLNGNSSRSGLRAVVVDVVASHPLRLAALLTSRSAAVLTVGGRPVLARAFDAGGAPVTRFGSAAIPAGRTRVVVRIATRDDGDSIVLQLLDSDGRPVATAVPIPGEPAAGAALAADGRAPFSGGSGSDERLRARGLLATGDARGAGVILEQLTSAKDAAPIDLLAYARALSIDSALPENRRVERLRDAYERARVAMPASWEASAGQAWLEGQRRGQAEARVYALAALRASQPAAHPMLALFEATMAGKARIRDAAAHALQQTRKLLGSSPAVAALDGLVVDRPPAARAAYWCTTPGLDRSSLDCHAALTELGEDHRAADELRRLRALRGSPDALLALELAAAVRARDSERVLRLYDSAPSGLRFFSPLGLLAAARPDDVSRRIARDLPAAPHDVGTALDLLIASQSASYRAWDERGARAVAEDRAHPAMKDAALLVLDHDEQYDVSDDGVVSYLIHDVRRVSGTTDVEESEQSIGPSIDGVDARRVLRRRVHKREGGVIEPEDPSQAEQRNADLSQLQAGDYVEQLLVGMAVPGTTGGFVLDSPDLMPERAGVHRAKIVVHLAARADLSRWAHPLFADTSPAVAQDGSTTWQWELADKPARRPESGVPMMDRRVRVTFGTMSWAAISRAMADTCESMQADDAVVAGLARQAAGNEHAPSAALVQRVVSVVGAKVPVASGAALSDAGALMASGPQRTTARTILESAHGSRTWLAREMLRSLGISSELVVAEEQPFSSSDTFPAHPGRFSHPLLVVQLPATQGGALWLDLDVAGPPLPPGRSSAELQGRSALRINGALLAVPTAAPDQGGDEIVEQIVVDARGDATGTVTIKLRGRAAQSLADVLETSVGQARQQMLRAVVMAWIPRADVTSADLSSGDDSWEVEVRATLSIPGFAQPEGKRLLLPGILPLHQVEPSPAASTLTEEYVSEAQRDSALALDDAVQYTVRRHIELPAGWKVVAAPESLSVQSARVRASRETSAMGPVVDESFRLSVAAGTVDLEHVGQFRGDARRIDDGFLFSIQVER